jgi:uncharacterized tellurite resistance protein B-like protein
MKQQECLAKGIIFLAHLMSVADGARDDTEIRALKRIRNYEDIPVENHQAIQQKMYDLSNEQIYNEGVAALRDCDKAHQLRAFAWLYKIVEVDGNIDVKEASFMLQAINSLGLDLNEVIEESNKIPDLG